MFTPYWWTSLFIPLALSPRGLTAPTSTAALCPSAPAPSFPLVAAPGWTAGTVLGGLTAPRAIKLDTLGNLLILQRGVGVTAHTLTLDGCVSSSKTIIADTTLNHAVELNLLGTKLFASSPSNVFSWDYNPLTQTATNKQTLIIGTNEVNNITRTLLVPRLSPNRLVVSVGPNANIDLDAFDPDDGHAQVRVFDLGAIGPTGVQYTSGQLLGFGLRNDVGLAEDRAGIVHSVENSIDDAFLVVDGQRQDIRENNPADKIYNLGSPALPPNLFGGYPFCFTVWDTTDFRSESLQRGDWYYDSRFVLEDNGTMTNVWCDQNARKPTVLLPPHSAPLDMEFGIGTDTNLYVGMHGSFDRTPGAGYKVVAVPGSFSLTGEWSPNIELVETVETSFTDILKNDDDLECNAATSGSPAGCFRPVGLEFTLTGQRLYISSDTTGEIFLLQKN
ncbi:hypothetical protein NLJ89_g10254 [Agrocybe chaxingu]|uniref:Pyrroloquinoline quinone-dependent pyranose dehydrogenase beta-propeller domain-containing protein n=1 Tax=Agrocybe chaxingu TaxID=84603 RepID=A0A9W8MR32_9AGAR|nr:hypothetical protein NLJ89_g10254 [Agrocybe chaxingu]